VVLTGENGSGKTNLIEAVSFLSPGRGLRRAAYGEVTRNGAADGFSVFATVENGEDAVEIGTGLAGNAPGDMTRRIRINGAPAAGAEALLDHVRILWLVPAMDGLFTGPSADRRRFLDRMVLAIDPAHGRRVAEYEKAMRGRNRLLADDVGDPGWLDAIEVQMAELGTAIAAARSELLRLIVAMIDRAPDDSPFPKADVGIEGALEAAMARMPAVEAEEGFRRDLAGGRFRDRAAGRALEGPHRTDLVIRHRPKDMPAARCSTGEQKALLIGLVLAHARLTGELAGMAPIILLDEIAAHLDEGRRAALYGIIDGLGGQAFMTGTDRALFSSLGDRARFFEVSAGAVIPADSG